jgi:hypothetical protein
MKKLLEEIKQERQPNEKSDEGEKKRLRRMDGLPL